jgi:hypothetical protein
MSHDNCDKNHPAIIWIIMALSTFTIGYSVVRMKFDEVFFVSLILITAEMIVIAANAWTCPLTNFI